MSGPDPAARPIECSTADHVRYITINRPERRNSLDDTTRHLLVEAFVAANADDEVRVVVLTGAGDKAFCAGRDLKQLNSQAAGSGTTMAGQMSGLERNPYEAVLETYKPTIALLNGPAVGGGFELALACDLRLAADHAFVQLPEAKRGMGANFSSVMLHRLLPSAIAFETLYLGDPLSPADALRWGLFNRVVPGSELQKTGADLAERIAANAPLTLRRFKQAAVKTAGMPLATALRLEPGPDPYASEDRVEGVRAFVEKRPPVWRGR